MSSSAGNSGAAIADGTPPRKVSDERDRSHQPAAAAGSSSSSSSSSVTGGVAGAAAASLAAAAAAVGASSGGGGGADGGVEDDDAVDSTDVEEYEMSKVDRDVREILHVEQSHIAHVGLMENLRQFYLAHNPRILQSPNFLRDLVSVFEGREKQLFEKLEQTYQTNDPMPAFVYSGGGRLGGHSIAGGRAPVSFLKNITMEGLLFRKPTLKGMRGKVQEIMQPHEGWFELCGSLLVWSQSPKTKPRGKLRLLPRTVAEAIGDRNFRIKTAGKILLMCQAKDKETRDEWVRKLQTTLEYLAMEAKQAQLLGQSNGGAARHSEAAAAAAAMEAAAAETSRITDAESDDDDEDPRSGGGDRHRTVRRQSRLADVDDTSSDDDAPTSGGGGALPHAQPQAVQPTGVMHVAVTSALAADPATDEAVDGFRRGARSSLQVAKRKILSASGVVAVTALAMQYYGLVPVLVSAVVGLLCIYGRFFDVTDAPPEAAGTVVLTAVPGAAAVFTPSTTAAAGAAAVGAPAASATGAKARGSSSSSRSRRKSVQSGQRGQRGSSSKRSSTSSKGGARGGGGGGDGQANSDDEAFEDCVNESMTAPSSAGDGGGGGGGSKDRKSAAAAGAAAAGAATGTRPGVVPPLHLYGELGVRFLPSEAGIVPRGLSFKLNDDFHPVDFETPFFRGRMVLRIKDAIGAAPTQYFDGRRRLFSIQVEGRFKQRLRTDRVLFGSSFKHKISMPRGASVAMSILRGIDPALRDDLFADENPWIMSPLICAVERLQARLPDPNDTEFNGLGPWRYGGGEAIEEDSSLTLPEEKRAKLGDKKMSFGQRRKYFADVKKRQVTFWEPGLVYTFDFLSARMDFNTYKVKMAKFIEFGTTKLMNKQPFQLEARVMDEADPNKKIGAMWAFEFCHNKVAPFAPEMEVIDHSNDL